MHDELARVFFFLIQSFVFFSPLSAPRATTTVAVGQLEARRVREALPVLRLLVNLSSADPTTITTWLTSCTPGWSPWGALKGLELELNNKLKKVRSAPLCRHRNRKSGI